MRVKIEETINLGNYESNKPAIEMEASLDQNDIGKWDECLETLHAVAQRAWAKAAMADVKAHIRLKGLPPENFNNLLMSLGAMIK